MHYQGLLIGLVSFIVIGVFHPIVIKCEYYYGDRVWPVFLVVGCIFLTIALFIPNVVGSAIFGVTGFACLWSIRELKEQRQRVERGWFPKNPERDDWEK